MRSAGFLSGAAARCPSSGNAAKKKDLACYVCGGPHKAMDRPNKHSADKASDRLPSSADETEYVRQRAFIADMCLPCSRS